MSHCVVFMSVNTTTHLDLSLTGRFFLRQNKVSLIFGELRSLNSQLFLKCMSMYGIDVISPELDRTLPATNLLL